MKLKALLALILVLTTMLCGCQVNLPTPTGISTEEATQPAALLAAECLSSLAEAKSAEELAAYLCDNSKERAEQLLDYYQSRNVSVEAQYRTKFQDYDVFYYEMKDTSGEIVEAGYALFAKSGDKYLCCVDSNTQKALQQKYFCTLCNGTGQINSGNWVACGICGGTGTQYIPNAYFDPATNMWMGMTQACAGCGGSGGSFSGVSIPCTFCGADGLTIP